jgi:hypothetical protein
MALDPSFTTTDNDQVRISGSIAPQSSAASQAFDRSFVLQEAGHARACFRRPLDTDRKTWVVCLWCTALVYGSVCVFVLLLAYGAPVRPSEATAQMEQLAAKLQSARVIPEKTAQELALLIEQPRFDCTRVACDARLEKRNREARNRLERLLAGKVGSKETTGGRITAFDR